MSNSLGNIRNLLKRQYGQAGISLWKWHALRTRFHFLPLPELHALLPDRGLLCEIGCGEGIFARAMLLLGEQRKFICCDISSKRLSLAIRSLPSPLQNYMRFVCGDALRLPLKPGTYAGAAIIEILYLMPVHMQREVLNQVRRIMPQGAGIVLCEPVADNSAGSRLMRMRSAILTRIAQFGGGKALVGQRMPGAPFLMNRNAFMKMVLQQGFSIHTMIDCSYPYPHALIKAIA